MRYLANILALFLLLSTTAHAQGYLTNDLTTPVFRPRPAFDPATNVFRIVKDVAGTPTPIVFPRTVNGIAPDAAGNVSVPGSATVLSAYNNDVGFLTNTTGDSRYPLTSGAYANPAFVSTLASTKITGTMSASNIGAFTGAFTTAGGSYNTTLSNSIVANANLTQAPALSIKGNKFGSVANVADLSVNETTTLLNLNLVPNVDATVRSNHTGTQPVTTVTGAVASVNGYAPTSGAVTLPNATTAVSGLLASADYIRLYKAPVSVPPFVLTAAAHGTSYTHNLGTLNVICTFKIGDIVDQAVGCAVVDANTVTLTTPFNGASRETATGKLYITGN